MSGGGVGDGAGRKPDHPEASGAAKVSLLAKWRWVRQVAADREIPREMLHTAFAVADLVNAELGFAFAGQAYIAGVVGVSDRSVGVHLQRLVAAGHLGVTRRGKAGASHYRLLQKWVGAPDCGGPHEPKPASVQNGSPEAHEPKPASGQSDLWQDYEPKPDVIMNRSRLRTNKLKNKRSESASPPRRGGGQANGSAVNDDPKPTSARSQVVPAVVADGVSDHVDFLIPQHVADEADRRRALERGWRALVGCEPVLGDLKHDPLHDAIAAGAVTAEDVAQGIREAMAKPGFRIEAWRQLVGYATTVAKRRMGASPKAIPASADAEPQRPADAIPVPGVGFRTVAQFEAHRERWDAGYPWDAAQFGDAPDSEFTLVPAYLRGPRRRRSAAVDRPADAVQSVAEQSIVSAGDHQ